MAEMDSEKTNQIDRPELIIPVDLAAALSAHAEAKSAFEKLSYSHRREYLKWIDEAKKPETRLKRIHKMVSELAK